MGEQHPITPPPEAVLLGVAEACCALLLQEGAWPWPEEVARLRAARRPKPPTLKEQALHELGDAYDKGKIDDTTFDTIKRALEALPK